MGCLTSTIAIAIQDFFFYGVFYNCNCNFFFKFSIYWAEVTSYITNLSDKQKIMNKPIESPKHPPPLTKWNFIVEMVIKPYLLSFNSLLKCLSKEFYSMWNLPYNSLLPQLGSAAELAPGLCPQVSASVTFHPWWPLADALQGQTHQGWRSPVYLPSTNMNKIKSCSFKATKGLYDVIIIRHQLWFFFLASHFSMMAQEWAVCFLGWDSFLFPNDYSARDIFGWGPPSTD